MDQKMIRILGGSTGYYPHALESKFPRILGTIMSLWDNDEEIDNYFMGLMVSNRPNRLGFPPDVATDIMQLSLIRASKAALDKTVDIWEASPKSFARFSARSESENSSINPPEALLAELNKYSTACTPQGFLEAAETGNRAAITLLLKTKISTEVRDHRGWTPLMLAAFNGRDEIVAMLIEHQADVNALDMDGNSALHWAAFGGHTGCMQMLIQHQAKIDEYNNFGWTPLIQATVRNRPDAVKLLMDSGANLDNAADDGYTALHKAVASGNLDVARQLLNGGANKNLIAIDGNTPCKLAVKSRDPALIKLFNPESG